jgi:multiple sugar transport system substrate-binding protein
MSLNKQSLSSISRRRFLQYTGTAAFSGSLLAACGNTTPGGSTSSNGQLELQQWYHQYGEAGTEAAAKRYGSEYTKALINVSWKPGDYFTQLNAVLLSGNPPDTFETYVHADQVKAGLLEPLDDLIAPVKNDFSATSLIPYTLNGKVYAIPMIEDTGLLYYRKSVLAKAGVKPPETMDELIAAAKKLTTSSQKGLFIGNDGGINALAQVAPWSAGSNFLTADNQLAFNNDRTVLAYQKVRELSQSTSILLGYVTDWADPGAITSGATAMQWGGLWSMPGIRKEIGDDFGVVPWPKLDAQGTPATFVGGWGAVVAAKGKHVQESKAFTQWLWIDNAKDQQDWNVNYGFHIPPRMSTAATATKLKSGQAADAVNIANQYGKPNPPLWDSIMGVALTDALSNIVKNGADPKAEVTKAEVKCQAELQKLLQ